MLLVFLSTHTIEFRVFETSRDVSTYAMNTQNLFAMQKRN
jgi:hypothetical protein